MAQERSEPGSSAATLSSSGTCTGSALRAIVSPAGEGAFANASQAWSGKRWLGKHAARGAYWSAAVSVGTETVKPGSEEPQNKRMQQTGGEGGAPRHTERASSRLAARS